MQKDTQDDPLSASTEIKTKEAI